MKQDDLEGIALRSSREHFRDTSQEDVVDNVLLVADGLLYAVAISSIWIAISVIDNDTLAVKEWEWVNLDWLLVGSAIGLWICSQSLNDFKRLLPLWLKLILRMKVLPSEFVEQSDLTRKRKMYSIYVAGILGFICSWRIYALDASIEARIGVPFHFIVLCLTLILFATGKYWTYLMRKEIKIKTL